MCDCETGLGSLATFADSADTLGQSDRALARKVQKLKAKGWSQSKIDRWLAHRDEAELKRERTAAHREQRSREHYTSDAERWLGILGEMIESGNTSSVGLLIHWYSGQLESERIDIQKRCRTRISDASPEVMLHMEPDVLYEFTK